MSEYGRGVGRLYGGTVAQVYTNQLQRDDGDVGYVVGAEGGVLKVGDTVRAVITRDEKPRLPQANSAYRVITVTVEGKAKYIFPNGGTVEVSPDRVLGTGPVVNWVYSRDYRGSRPPGYAKKTGMPQDDPSQSEYYIGRSINVPRGSITIIPANADPVTPPVPIVPPSGGAVPNITPARPPTTETGYVPSLPPTTPSSEPKVVPTTTGPLDPPVITPAGGDKPLVTTPSKEGTTFQIQPYRDKPPSENTPVPPQSAPADRPAGGMKTTWNNLPTISKVAIGAVGIGIIGTIAGAFLRKRK
jgi:hypothetical protein